MNEVSKTSSKPRRIRFWHDGERWYVRASFQGSVPVGSGSSPEEALAVLAENIAEIRANPDSRFWESAWSRAKRDLGLT